MPDAYLPLKRLAEYSGLSVRTLRTYIAGGATPLPHYRIGGRIVVRQSEFDAWASQFRVASRPMEMDAFVADVIASLR